MKKYLYIVLCLLNLSSCGKLPDLNSLTPSTPTGSAISTVVAGPYSPGSYFKILKDVDKNKDTRIYEFQYLSNNSFIILQKSFPAGNLASGYFHKTAGTYSEDKYGNITHTILYDTCNDLTTSLISISGNPKDIVNIFVKGTNLSFYSAITWAIPVNISSNIGTIVEDIGCKKF